MKGLFQDRPRGLQPECQLEEGVGVHGSMISRERSRHTRLWTVLGRGEPVDCARSRGLPAGFRFAERACGPPFGSSVNPQDPRAHRPSACPQALHTVGLRLESKLSTPPTGSRQGDQQHHLRANKGTEIQQLRRAVAQNLAVCLFPLESPLKLALVTHTKWRGASCFLLGCGFGMAPLYSTDGGISISCDDSGQ